MPSLAEPTEEQLTSIFHFKGKEFPQNQTVHEISELVKLLSYHCSQMEELPACEDHFRNSSWKSLLLSAAQLMQDDRSVKWFPKYGCALLAIPSRDVPNEPIARRHLYIVGLDSWVLKAHWISSSSGRGTLEHGSVPAGASIIGGGNVAEQKWDALYAIFSRLQRDASTKRGDERSAACGNQGHQFPPASAVCGRQGHQIPPSIAARGRQGRISAARGRQGRISAARGRQGRISAARGRQGHQSSTSAVCGRQGHEFPSASAARGRQGYQSSTSAGRQGRQFPPASTVCGREGHQFPPASAVYGRQGHQFAAASAARGRQGHQFTPAMIGALLREAHSIHEQEVILTASTRSKEFVPRGGFTDVGQHTGGHPRNTAWPLACEVFKSALLTNAGHGESWDDNLHKTSQDVHLLFQMVKMDFELQILERRVAGQSGVPNELNETMEMHQKIASAAGEYADSGHSPGKIVPRLERVRELIDRSAASRAELIAKQYKLRIPTTNSSSISLPRIAISTLPQYHSATREELVTAKVRPEIMLGLPELGCAGEILSAASVYSAIVWVKHEPLAPGKGVLQAQVVIREVEALFFSTASQRCIENAAANLESADVTNMIELILSYRAVVDDFLATRAGNARMIVEMRSREILVSWIAYAVAFGVTRSKWRVPMQNFGVCLCPDDLRHLVLSDKISRDAMLQVAAYLRRHTHEGKAIFCLADGGDATFELAATIGHSSTYLQEIWGNELQAAKQRQENHWKEVKHKKLSCAKLRYVIHDLKAKLLTQRDEARLAKRARVDCPYRHETCPYRHETSYCASYAPQCGLCAKYLSAERACTSAEQDIHYTQSALAIAMNVQPVLQPLPNDEASALSVIFFLFMPEDFRALSLLSFMAAQQMLLPREWHPGVEAVVKVSECYQLWSSYYNEHQSSKYHSTSLKLQGEDGDVMLGIFGEVGKPETSVDLCTMPTDGVWHPDDLAPGRMMWIGGRYNGDRKRSCFNPFSGKVQPDWMVEEHTERLKERSLQWAMPQRGFESTARSRGNMAIATQGHAPSWLDKVAYIAFGTLRAYPLLQLRKLAVALRERSLPFDQPDVRTLVRQALFHVGDISSRAPIRLLWREDEMDLFATLFDELRVHTEEIKHTPRHHRNLQLLVDVACYVGDWYNECKLLVRSHIAKIAWNWAIDVDNQIAEAEARRNIVEEAAETTQQDKVVSLLKAKQCTFYMYGVLCFGGSATLSAADIARLCEFHILAHNRRIFSQEESMEEDWAHLHVRCLNVMAGRRSELMRHARHNYTFITKVVTNTLECTPSHLTWRQLPSTSTCYEAESGGHVYSVNLLTGEVLFDGTPPCRLPREIVSAIKYSRTFGSSNIEVTKSPDELYTTAKAIDGRFYEFSYRGLTFDGRFYDFFNSGFRRRELVIEEIERESGMRLELLDHNGSWSKYFPVWLRDLSSHWLNREKGVIVVRPKCFRHREVDYICRCDATCGLASIYRVPGHRRGIQWAQLLEDAEGTECSGEKAFDRLVLAAEGHPVVSSLKKFERSPEILTFLKADGGLLFEFPRFRLQFLINPTPPQGQMLSRSGVQCLNHRGYELASDQQFSDTLAEFTRYLVLTPKTKGEAIRIIVPQGRVVVRENTTPFVTVECVGEDNLDTDQDVHCYEVHPRWKGLQSDGVSSRLQLAALYAASGTLLPEPRSRMIGSEKASELVRRCTVNHPLTQEDRDQLVRIVELSGHNATLAIICGNVLKCSEELKFLHSSVRDNLTDNIMLARYLEDAETAYEGECASREWNRRRRLKPLEEVQILGRHCSRIRKPLAGGRIVPACGMVNLRPCLVAANDVAAAERALWNVTEDLAASVVTSRNSPPYPLCFPPGESELSDEMHAELRESWDVHNQSSLMSAFPDSSYQLRLREGFALKRNKVSQMRQVLEQFLLGGLANFGEDWHAASWHIQRVAALLPTVSLQDLPAMLLEKGRIQEWNPFLSRDSLVQIQAGITSWLRLCVLEDKLERLERWAGSTGSQALLWREMQVRRTWQPEDHPEWLIFEVDGGLQIRQTQADVALHMIDNPGDVIQLNMGEGKTRVILPLLLLHWAQPSRSPDTAIVRLHFLGALLGEAFHFLHRTLTASLLERPMFVMPFYRDVQLTEEGARAMRGCLERCRREGGAVLVAPEHRYSLHLKGLELRTSDPHTCEEIRKFEGGPFRDIFDESDELLHHREQLIYAMGALQHLPALEHRAHAVQALLRVLKHRKRHKELDALLSDPGIASEEISYQPEQFGNLRLVSGPKLEAIESQLRHVLFKAVASDPPYELKWLLKIPTHLLLSVQRLILDERTPAKDALDRETLAEESQWEQLMAFRGQLAMGTFFHCLQMRHRVNYGVSRTGSVKKRLAIPFRASNTPAERSEWKQPDVAITVTVLSYYYDGLSKVELREALTKLLSMKDSAQADYFKRWLALTTPPPEDLKKMDHVRKVDLSNVPQIDLMHKHLGRNYEVVNFWLNLIVLPGETRLCPRFIGANSWFLAQNKNGAITGFSGTNDNHRLLPLQVRKSQDNALPSISGTNGRMLDLILRNNRYITLKQRDAKRSNALPSQGWKILLQIVVDERADALIDCGALLGQANGREAATFLLSADGALPTRFRGVVFFDALERGVTGGGSWTVLDRVGHFASLNASSIRAAEAFCIYDEARCRGADLKLSPDARAVLTVGPKNGKDKVMQAAGRLRLLGRSKQSIVFVGSHDVSTKIRELVGLKISEPISSKNVLEYVMANTVKATQSGLLEWARQGLNFLETFGRPDRAEVNEQMTLQETYGSGFRPISVARAASEARQQQRRRCKDDIHDPNMAAAIVSRSERYGNEVTVSRDASLKGECECETQVENEVMNELMKELELETELQVEVVSVSEEHDWDHASVLSATSVDRLPFTAEVQSMGAMRSTLSEECQIRRLRCPSLRVCYTKNFWWATEMKRGQNFDDYLRPVDAVLAFEDGTLLLLSEREADRVLHTFAAAKRKGRIRSYSPTLMHLSYTGLSSEDEVRVGHNPLMQTAALGARRLRDSKTLASVWIVAGKTTIPEDGREAVKALIKGSANAVRYLVAARGKGHMLPRSDLERLLIQAPPHTGASSYRIASFCDDNKTEAPRGKVISRK